MKSKFKALKDINSLFLVIGQGVSSIGDYAFTVALAMEIFNLTGSATIMGLVITVETLPQIVFFLVGGVIADSFSKFKILIFSEFTRGIIVLFLGMLGLIGTLEFWMLFILSFFFGIIKSLYKPAYRSVIPEIIKKNNITMTNSLIELSKQLGMTAGPAIGSILAVSFSTYFVFVFNGVTFLISGMAVFYLKFRNNKIQILRLKNEKLTDVTKNIKEGLYYVYKENWLSVSIIISSFANMLYIGSISVTLPALITGNHPNNIWLLGFFNSVCAVTQVVLTLIYGSLNTKKNRGVKSYYSLILVSISFITLGITPFLGTITIHFLITGILLGFVSVYNIIWTVLIQELVPLNKLGRVFSISLLGSMILSPLGVPLMGFVSDTIGANNTFLLTGFALLFISLIGLSIPTIRKLQ